MPSDWRLDRSSCVMSRINHCVGHCMQQTRPPQRPPEGHCFFKFCQMFLVLPEEEGMRTPVAAAILAFSVSMPGLAQVSPAQPAATVYTQQSGYVDANGVLIYYVEFGKGAPLMVLHGGPGADHTYFLPWLLPLARTHRLIFIDERGSGQSERLQDVSKYTIENMADDVEAVRVALGLGKIDLLGHSCGGVLAEAYAF